MIKGKNTLRETCPVLLPKRPRGPFGGVRSTSASGGRSWRPRRPPARDLAPGVEDKGQLVRCRGNCPRRGGGTPRREGGGQPGVGGPAGERGGSGMLEFAAPTRAHALCALCAWERFVPYKAIFLRLRESRPAQDSVLRGFRGVLFTT